MLPAVSALLTIIEGLPVLTHLVFPTVVGGLGCYHSPFTDKEAKAGGSEANCPGPHSPVAPDCVRVGQPEELGWLVSKQSQAGQRLETQRSWGAEPGKPCLRGPRCNQWAPGPKWGDAASARSSLEPGSGSHALCLFHLGRVGPLCGLAGSGSLGPIGIAFSAGPSG